MPEEPSVLEAVFAPPRSARYGDTYYSGEDGWAECWHVFVRGNRLEERFAGLRAGEVFAVGELGYGTGLNVAAAMTAFARRGHARGHLAVFSVEGHPLSRAAFADHAARAAARWPAAAAALAALAACYPEPSNGFAHARPAPGVTLTLGFGEAEGVLGQAHLAADAWFLDGFSPALNPAMWSEAVLGHVARLSAPGATAATFTVAGAVRRGLGAAGFAVAKAPGFGRKREMSTARLPGAPNPAAPSPAVPGPIAVLGGGIAGASVAWHLARMGRPAVLFDREGVGAGASGNPGGLVTPRVEATDNTAARFYRDAYLYALGFYAEAAPGAFTRTGATVRIAADRAAKVRAAGLWPEGALVEDPGGLAAIGAGVLRPAEAVRALASGVLVRRADGFEAAAEGWRVGGERFGVVVVAAPALAATLDLGVSVLTGKRGQVDVFEGACGRVVTGDGYAAPLGDALMAGATYAPAALDGTPKIAAADTGANAETARRLTGWAPGAPLAARAAVRAATPDRHPLAGPVPDVPAVARSHAALREGGQPSAPLAVRPGLYVLSGLGSRGLVTAPLLGAHVAAAITGAPSPLTSEADEWLHPARFFLRALRRKQA